MERKGATATAAARGHSASRTTPTHIRGKKKGILLAFAVMTIPMLLFSSLLLGLVYHYRVVFSGFESTDLSFEVDNNAPDVFYVALSATTLTTIASWSSTIAPLLVGYAVTLGSYLTAGEMLRAVGGNQPEALPTPHQFSLMLQILSNGSVGSLWSWLRYSFGWRNERERQPTVLLKMIWVLLVGLFVR